MAPLIALAGTIRIAPGHREKALPHIRAIVAASRAEPGCKGTDAFPINLPESVANKAGGKPHTAFLTNMTMETFFQAGDQAACNQVENGNCPATLAPGAPVVFATESCIGCHSSASIAVGGTAKTGVTPGTQLTADFSWLLSQKAHWKTN